MLIACQHKFHQRHEAKFWMGAPHAPQPIVDVSVGPSNISADLQGVK